MERQRPRRRCVLHLETQRWSLPEVRRCHKTLKRADRLWSERHGDSSHKGRYPRKRHGERTRPQCSGFEIMPSPGNDGQAFEPLSDTRSRIVFALNFAISGKRGETQAMGSQQLGPRAGSSSTAAGQKNTKKGTAARRRRHVGHGDPKVPTTPSPTWFRVQGEGFSAPRAPCRRPP